MSSSSSLGILMTKFPGLEVMSETQTFFGVGYVLGPLVGAMGAYIGGFRLPFLVVGGFNIIVPIALIFIFPKPTEAEVAQVEPIQAEPAQAEAAETEHHETGRKLGYFNFIFRSNLKKHSVAKIGLTFYSSNKLF